MNRQLKMIRVSFAVTVGCFALSSLMLCMIPFIQIVSVELQKVIDFSVATVFWVGITGGCIFVKITFDKLRKYRRKLIFHGYIEQQKRPGIISFSNKTTHIILYTCTCTGIAAIICDLIWHFIPEYFAFPILACTFFSFVLHCIIDGKYFKTYNIIKEGIDNEN